MIERKLQLTKIEINILNVDSAIPSKYLCLVISYEIFWAY